MTATRQFLVPTILTLVIALLVVIVDRPPLVWGVVIMVLLALLWLGAWAGWDDGKNDA